MQAVLAIAGLTWKAAFRFRLFLVLTGLLLVAVVGLPLLIQDDGTARGFRQPVGMRHGSDNPPSHVRVGNQG